MTDPLRILVVCTANICRSPATVALMRRELPSRLGEAPLLVESAGIGAGEGHPACDLSSALVGEYVARRYAGQPAEREATTAVVTTEPAPHASRRVTAALVGDADLILALDRSHRAELTRLTPAARPRTFTLRQAARLAQSVSTSLTAGMLPPGAPPLPRQPADRFRWLVGELDAARGTGSATAAQLADPAARPRWDWHDDDVPDPHVLGYQIHPLAVESLQEAAARLDEVIITVAGFGNTGSPGASTYPW